MADFKDTTQLEGSSPGYLTEEQVRALIASSAQNQVGTQRLVAGDYSSGNFVTNSAGWSIDSLGNAEFNAGVFRGALSASTIDIGGSDATSFHVDIDGNIWSGAAAFNISTNPFAVSNAGVLRAVSGTIGGFTLSATSISATGLSISTTTPSITVGTGGNAVTLNGSSGTISSSGGEWSLAGDGTTSLTSDQLTAGEDIAQYDSVYISASNTVKKYIPTALGTETAVSTSVSHAGRQRALQLSNGVYIHIANAATNGVLYAQVRTLNAAETDFTNGSEQIIYNTTTGVFWFDACVIDTNKVAIFYLENAGGSATGISVVVLTVSGSTITLGTAVTIEATGSLGMQVSICKLDTDKALLVYKADADNYLKTQVITVSGTTVTTNTAATVKASAQSYPYVMVRQLTTNVAMLLYCLNGASGVTGNVITVSGTTPTVGADQSVLSGSAGYYITLEVINSTTALAILIDAGGGTPNENIYKVTRSGDTITLGSAYFAYATATSSSMKGLYIISDKRALYSTLSTVTTHSTILLDISGATPAALSSDSSTVTDTTGDSHSYVCKVKPWVYTAATTVANGDFLYTLTSSYARVGVATETIASSATGTVYYRFIRNYAMSGLIAGTRYYIDDNAQPTASSSLAAPVLGEAISSTKILQT